MERSEIYLNEILRELRAICARIPHDIRLPGAAKMTEEMANLLDKYLELRTLVNQPALPYSPNQTAYSSGDASPLPCDICGGGVVEYSIPNDIWNRVIRLDGHEHNREYLCIACFFDALRTALGLRGQGNA